MKKLERGDYRSLLIQGILLALASWCLYVAFQIDIKPANYIVVLFVIHGFLYFLQWRIKINVLLIFILLIGWTLICVTSWPDKVLIKNINPADYSLSLSGAALALSGWIMHSFNKSRW